MNQELLQQYRDQVETIDMEIVYLLSRRFENVKQIGLLKKEEGIDVHQGNRWEYLLGNILSEADDKMLESEFIKKVWDLIHEESKKYQKNIDK
ncbi:MAG: chorismate mutase [Candidatus Gracilibacteria bacterium]|nr:chorismate mutase [Candidatus Gracilibacteria bacterium]